MMCHFFLCERRLGRCVVLTTVLVFLLTVNLPFPQKKNHFNIDTILRVSPLSFRRMGVDNKTNVSHVVFICDVFHSIVNVIDVDNAIHVDHGEAANVLPFYKETLSFK